MAYNQPDSDRANIGQVVYCAPDGVNVAAYVITKMDDFGQWAGIRLATEQDIAEHDTRRAAWIADNRNGNVVGFNEWLRTGPHFVDIAALIAASQAN